MKLPSIKPEKPNSASSQRSAKLPPKSQNPSNTSGSLTANLERNLFKKLQQYDELHNIKPTKPSSVKESLNYQDVLQEMALDKFLSSPYQEPIRSSDMKQFTKTAVDSDKMIKSKGIEADQKKKNTIRFIDGQENLTDKPVISQPLTAQEKSGAKLKPILGKKSNIKKESKKEEENQAFITTQQLQDKDDSESEQTDEEEQINTMIKRNQERQEIKKMLLNPQDQDLIQVGEMIVQTNSEMTEYFSFISNIKKNITQLQNGAISIGYGVRPELLEQLEDQFKEIMEMQKEDEALDEFQIKEMRDRKGRRENTFPTKASYRANSLAAKNRDKTKRNNNNKLNESFDN